MSRPVTRRVAASLALAATGAGIIAGGRRRRVRPLPALPGRHTEVAGSDGTRLRVTLGGPAEASCAVILVHGWAMDSTFWRPCASELAAGGLAVVAYDQRGHGRSEDPGTGGTSLEAIGSDLQAVLDRLPEGLLIILVGHSMGAIAIVQWASQHRDDRVIGSVLFNTGVHGLVPACADSFGRAAPPLRPLLQTILTSAAPLRTIPPATLRGAVAYAAHGPVADRQAIDHTTRLVCQSRPQVRAGFGRSLAAMDLRSRMGQHHLPVLVVAGSHDRMTPVSLAEAMAAGLPEARLEIVDGAGHQTPLDAPDRSVALVRAHLEDVLGQERRRVA